MNCDELGPELVALALGALSPDDAAKLDAHVAQCSPCRGELDATKRLLTAARAAPAAEPSAAGLEKLLGAFRAERDAGHPPAPADVPAPAATPWLGKRILSIAVPLAAAASIMVAVSVGTGAREARVIAGDGFFIDAGALPGASVSLGSATGEFEFGEGDEISAAAGRLSVRIDLEPGTGAAHADTPSPGRVELTLRPGARLVRRSSSDLDLLAGTIDVAAGPLGETLTVHAGSAYAAVRGTRFTASTTERRLVVTVDEGSVELGRDGGPSETLTSGEEGLVDAERLLERRADGRRRGEGFLTPRAHLAVDEAAPGPRLRAWLDAGDGGAVAILPFDDSEPRFLLRLKGHDGREREVKLQRTMLAAAPPAAPPGAAARTWRLDAGTAYELSVDPKALGLAPGRYEASLRYMSYRARSDGAEWLGVVESDPVTFEVPAR